MSICGLLPLTSAIESGSVVSVDRPESCLTLPQMPDNPKALTLKELREFDGRDGRPAYVAFEGEVYDVSGSTWWAGGSHLHRHAAGADLTPEIANAPHSEAMLGGFPVVGKLKEESYGSKLQKRVESLHAHSMLTHFSVGISLTLSFFALLCLATGKPSFDTTSYYLLLVLLVVTPLSGLSGFLSWRLTYEGRRSRIFDRKIALTVVLTILVVACGVWRISEPTVLVDRSLLSYVYFFLLAMAAVVTAALGHYGGKIVFP
jgi:predicted heme/steroid binding protein/uncharacterized membrane protein